MNNQRGTIKALSVLAILATAGGAAAQEPWVAPQGSTTTTATQITTTQIEMPPDPVPNYGMNRDVGVSKGTNKLDQYMAPPRRAFELQLGGGYGQGLGNVARGESTLSDISGAGATIQLTLGYRATPHFMIGIYGTGSEFSRGNVTDSHTTLRSATAGIQADFHIRPSFTIDPWVSLASGVRGYFASSDIAQDTTTYGLQLARVQLGLDFRLTRQIAVSPVIGGDASLFLTRSGPLTNGFDNIQSPRINYFLFGGLQARFDVGGSHKSYSSYASSGTSSSF